MRTAEDHAVASAIIRLMRGVVYRESDEGSWTALDRQGPAIRDHFDAIGVEVVVDDSEGYAYLRSQDEVEELPLPRLIMRRSLTYNVSLLLVLLRKRLVEFETSGSEGKLVLNRDQFVDQLRLFLIESTNEVRMIETIDTTIRKAVELGFLRQFPGHPEHWEVRRILKAYIDAQTMSEFATKLADYAGRANGEPDE